MIVHKEVLREHCWAQCVFQDVEASLEVNVTIRPVATDLLLREILFGGIGKTISKNVSFRLTFGCVDAPTSRIGPRSAITSSIDVNTDTDDILRPANKTLTIHTVAALLEWYVIVFRNEERRIVASIIEVRHNHLGNLSGVEGFSELSVRTAFARSEDSVAIVD